MLIKTQTLLPEVRRILCEKATEYPRTGQYDMFDQPGTYLCRQCGLALFRSNTKFHSGCGWPSFEEEIKNAVLTQLDADRIRSEIICSQCHGHLGHVFHGEGFTAKNTRHCVNSASLDFVNDVEVKETEEAILGAGCFWGVEYYFKKLPGVLKVEVGYTGGHKDYPSYNDVCQGNSGHIEAIRVVYDTNRITYQDIIKYFFEIHDPTQKNSQGPDLGEQYLSIIFYYTEDQKKISEDLIEILSNKNLDVATQLRPVAIFWPAEEYHQNYYEKNKKHPYCHTYTKRF